MTTVPEKSTETFGMLTDEAFARSRPWPGVPRPQQNKPVLQKQRTITGNDVHVALPEPPGATIDGMLAHELTRDGVGR